MSVIGQIRAGCHAVNGPVLVSGSAVMVLNGIDRSIDDLDLFTTTEHWCNVLLSQDWVLGAPSPVGYRRCDPPQLSNVVDGLVVNLFCQWRHREVGNIDIAYEWDQAEHRHGLDCIRLSRLLAWKAEMQREKDLADIELIARRLRELDAGVVPRGQLGASPRDQRVEVAAQVIGSALYQRSSTASVGEAPTVHQMAERVVNALEGTGS